MQPSTKGSNKCVPRKSDIAMKTVWHTLRQDFSSNLGFPIGTTPAKSLDANISAFRDYIWPNRMALEPYHMKCEYQLENWLKRYRFVNDKYTDNELGLMQIEKQKADISRLSNPIRPSLLVYKVLQRARLIVKNTLGDYNEEEHLALCRFGKRSSVGSSYRKSYLDLKVVAPIQASSEQIRWFKNYLKSDILLARVIQKAKPKGRPLFKICTHLTCSSVPKSYKSLRGITPNTLIGTFHSYGLGKVITSRLRTVGLDIRYLQQRHGILAKKFSKSKSHCTADLSSASDSITLQLLMYLLPRPWLKIFKMGHIRRVLLQDGNIYNTPTFCGMGIGFTFPLETLVFYSLLKAIQELSSSGGIISVYGDDLIYPSTMHKYVRSIFPQLGLILNEDKTYVKQAFRESCGSDFYRGVDVRPVSPEGHTSNSRLPYTAFLYKIANSLLRKWEPCEIPRTLYYLKREIIGTNGSINVVPPSYPEYSGLRSDTPCLKHFSFNRGLECTPSLGKSLGIHHSEWWVPYEVPKYYVKRGKKVVNSWVFRFLEKISEDRLVTSCYPYYWDALRAAYGKTYSQIQVLYNTLDPSIFKVLGESRLKDISSEIVDEFWDDPIDSTQLRWRVVKPPPKNYRSKLTGKRLKCLEPIVQAKVEQSTRRTTGAIEEWY